LFIPFIANTDFFRGASVWLALKAGSIYSMVYCKGSEGSGKVGYCAGLRKGDDLFLIVVYFSNLRVEFTT
jgi:hypothetical protein